MYIVEGNIGVGKSTFLTLMENTIPGCQTILEPVDSWNHQEYGASLLELFYRDTPRWAYTLETLSLKCRVRSHLAEQINPEPFRLMERSVYSGHYVFAKNDHKLGFLTDLEWSMYQTWVDFLVNGHCRPPLGFIYLRAEPQICFERMQKRNRTSESTTSLEYLEQVHAQHENFLIHKNDVDQNIVAVPVLTLDCNQDFESNPTLINTFKHSVENFFSKTALPNKKEFDARSFFI